MRTPVLLAALAISGCATSGVFQSAPPPKPETAHVSRPSPCYDQRYTDLKHRPLDELTEREYEYLMQKGSECTEFQAEAERRRAESEERSRMARHVPGWITWYMVATLVSVGITLFLLP